MADCYNGNSTTCSNPPSTPTLPITERDVYTYIAGTGKDPLTVYKYDSYSRVIDIKTYDFGGAPGGTNFATDESFGYGTWDSQTGACVNQTEPVQGVTVPITGLLCAHAVTTPGTSGQVIVSYHLNSYAANTTDLTYENDLVGGLWRQ